MVAEKKIFTDVLRHFITIAEIQKLQLNLNQAVMAKDYAGASEINQILTDKQQGLLSLDEMKEYYAMLTKNGVS